MSADLVVTVPARLWAAWIAEGDLPSKRWSGAYWSFYLGSAIPSRVTLTGSKRLGATFFPTADGHPDDDSPGDRMTWDRRDLDSVWHLAGPDQRVYVVALGQLRGYAPLYAIQTDETERELQAFIRRGGAVAVTVDQAIRGFRGWRYRWWERNAERAFPDWQTAGLKP